MQTPDNPSKGGAAKTRVIDGRAWTEHARARWAELTNKTLERVGRIERVDHRSYERQGIDQPAGRHYGPSAAHVVSRGDTHYRLEIAAGTASDRDRLESIDQTIAALETERGALASEDQKRTEGSGPRHPAEAIPMARHVIMTTPDRGNEMTNALDVFREQQDAAKQVHARLSESPRLLEQLQGQITAILTALAFALLSAVAVGTGYSWIAKPYAVELATLRPQAELGLFVGHRITTMTPVKRRHEHTRITAAATDGDRDGEPSSHDSQEVYAMIERGLLPGVSHEKCRLAKARPEPVFK